MPTWDVEFTDTFETWWDGLSGEEQESVAAVVNQLVLHGPQLPHPMSSDIRGARHGEIRELRIQHAGKPYRVLYAFDPRRVAILLLGGRKDGKDRWYDVHVPKADSLFDDHLAEIERERLQAEAKKPKKPKK